MLYLAWEAFADTGSASAVRGGGQEGFRRGLIANILNPKALLFYIIVVGQFVDPASGPVWAQIILLGRPIEASRAFLAQALQSQPWVH